MDRPFETEAHDIRAAAVTPILQPGPLFWPLTLFLSLIVLAGAVAMFQQLMFGLGVTGLNNRVSWGFYITDMVFFIGLSYGGAVTSAILRLTNAPWRAPMVRLAEATALVTLLIGSLFPIIDLGRPDRMLNLLLHGQVGSPVLWDVVAINTYMVATVIFLFLPLIPDMAICRDHLGPAAGRLRKLLYDRLSLGWRGTPGEKNILERNMTVVAVVIIPLAVSVHSVLAWLFGMTVRPGWNSTIYAPYFVVGALFSGVAAVIVIIAAFRQAYHLEAFITEQHFKYLANMLLALGMAYGYFLFAEVLTEGYKMEGVSMGEGSGSLLQEMLLGRYALLFWGFVAGGLVIPIALTSLPLTRNVPGIVIAATLVVVAMWVKRFLIVVPAMATPLMPMDWGAYWPSRVEIAITLAAVAAVPLMLMLFFRIFPILSIYEMEEFAEHEELETGPEASGVAAW
ncbi:MAG: NrfD/PsrC family molybdoenzyme membrane anchor subunit [Dehalococcoidia bacterium]|nr:NrfD/PsrC family molybdoenzyme membrane anchor subunit [Dehalococcoidia bacterium]